MPLHFSQPPGDILRKEHIVRDCGDLFGFLPRFLEKVQLSLERAPLGFFVRSHLERKSQLGRDQRKDRPLAVDPPAGSRYCETHSSLERGRRVSVLGRKNDRVLDLLCRSSGGVQYRQQLPRDAQGIVSAHVGVLLAFFRIQRWKASTCDRKMLDAQSPGFVRSRLQHSSSAGVDRSDPKKISMAIAHSCDHAPLLALDVAQICYLKDQSARSTERDPQRQANEWDCGNASGYRHPLNDVLPAAPPELISVTPGRELGPLWFSDAHELEPLIETCQPDLLGRNTKLRVAVRPLALLDGLQALIDGRQIPAFAFPAHHPQASLRGVECEPSPDWKVLDRLVGAERRVAEEARRIHSAKSTPLPPSEGCLIRCAEGVSV